VLLLIFIIIDDFIEHFFNHLITFRYLPLEVVVSVKLLP
jgi:hypothetical protein